MPFVEREARGGDPVAEGDAAARQQHAAALRQRPALVWHVEEPFLADHDGEGGRREGQALRVRPHHPRLPAP